MITVGCLSLSEKVKFQLRGKMNHQNIRRICGNENWYTAIEHIRNSTKVNASVPYHIFILFCRGKYSDKNLLFGRADGMVFPTAMEVSTTPFANRMGLPHCSLTWSRGSAVNPIMVLDKAFCSKIWTATETVTTQIHSYHTTLF